MATQNIRWRLAPEGGDKVVAEARRAEQAIVQGQAGVASATDKAVAAADRQIAKLRETAQAAAATTEMQRRIEALAGGSTRLSLQDQYSAPGNANARVSARIFEVGEVAYERRAQEIKKAIDPLGAAHARLNDELREYDTLLKANKLTLAQHAQAQAQSRQRFDEAAVAIQRNERGLTRLAVASRLNLARQGSDVFVTAAMGMNPAMIAIQQGPQILDALATSGIKASSGLLVMGGALTAAAAGVVLLGAAWMRGQDAAATYSDLTTGVGRTAGLTADKLRDLTVAAADNGEISRKAARGMAVEYLATGKIGSEVLGDLIALNKDYASFAMTDSATATTALAKAMEDPKKAAHDWTLQYGLLNQEQLTNIDNMIEQDNLLGAQKLLIEEVTKAARGHADGMGEVSDAWEATARWISNAVDGLGEWLYLTGSEKLQQQIDFRAAMERRGGPRTASEQAAYDQAGARAMEIINAREKADRDREQAAGNQSAERDRVARERREKEAERAAKSARAEANRAQREAEREARELRQRTRQEEDRQAQIDMEVARARGDFDGVRAQEDANAVRVRERQLIDAGTTAEEARTKALEEQQVLIAARAEAADREIDQVRVGRDLERLRLYGMNATVARIERGVELEGRKLAYQKQGLVLADAIARAGEDQEQMDIARADAAERSAAAREREWKMALAQASGNRGVLRDLNRTDWIARRAEEIEKSDKLNRGGGVEQATREYGQMMRAETTGAFRDGVHDLVADIRHSGLDDALGEQFDIAGERLISKLIDGLIDMDWGSMLSGGDGSGSWLSKGFDFLFGNNARGTNYWDGGLTWVGEEGPELADLPRGTRIRDNASSMAMLRQSAHAAPRVTNNYFNGNLMTPDFWAEIRRGDVEAAQQGMYGGADLAVGAVRASAAAEQRQRRMLKE